ncbi:MAG TPA: tetratricopeptide repeat protein, partial [Planctomycetaceae bacterium]|nr:tetratricopeptide repeat protein [Planctomycetaceae bacterium]
RLALDRKPTGRLAAHALTLQVLCLARAGQWDELAGPLARLQKHVTPKLAVPAIHEAAELAYDAGRFKLAAELFDKVVAATAEPGRRASALSGLAWCRYQMGQYAVAAELFARVANEHKGQPEAAEAAFMSGMAWEAAEQPGKAIEAYRSALTGTGLGRYAFKAGLHLARLLARGQESAEAAVVYEKLTKDYPDSSQLDTVLNEWAWLCVAQRQEGRARELFERLIRECPNSKLVPAATLSLCEGLFVEGKYEEVLSRLEPLLARPDLGPQLHEAVLYRLGRTAAELGQWDKARNMFQRLISEHGRSRFRAEAEFWLAEADRQQGEPVKAAERLRKLLEDEPPAEPWLPLAWL